MSVQVERKPGATRILPKGDWDDGYQAAIARLERERSASMVVKPVAVAPCPVRSVCVKTVFVVTAKFIVVVAKILGCLIAFGAVSSIVQLLSANAAAITEFARGVFILGLALWFVFSHLRQATATSPQKKNLVAAFWLCRACRFQGHLHRAAESSLASVSRNSARICAANIRDPYQQRGAHRQNSSPSRCTTSGKRSRHVGLACSISAIFQSRRHRFNKYSRLWAVDESDCSSKYTRRPTQ